MTNPSLAWPALDLAGQALPETLSYERGVWGKVPGAATDYRWIAASRTFLSQNDGLERELNLGTEDEPRRAFFWRRTEAAAHAVTSYPSRARDEKSRDSFIEKQVLTWRLGDSPAALGALLLLPRIAEWSDEVWWSERSSSRFQSRDFVLGLDEEEHRPVAVFEEAVEQAIEIGLLELETLIAPRDLTELLAALLAGERAVPLPGLGEPLPAAALAALLLPLPRPVSDRLSLAGWVPSGRFEVQDLARRWDVVGGTKSTRHLDGGAVAAQRPAAEPMAQALLERRPADLRPRTAVAAGRPAETAERAIQIALWGPSAAGKTVLIAQLGIHRGEAQDGLDWKVYPDEASLEFIRQMRGRMRRSNHFPKATVVGVAEPIVYNFENVRTGVCASMVVEDRAGHDFETLHEEAQERLRTADGLVVLFDPTREQGQLETEIAQTLDEVYVSRGKGKKDSRPIAVCVSKADVLVKSLVDYEQAVSDGETFVREKVHPTLVRTVEHLCAHYRLFPMSSAGLKVRHGIIEPNVFYDETLTPRIGRGGVPLNLLEPFAWVLDEVTR